MGVLDITIHELVGVSRSGELCSCGVTDESWLEHLGDVAVGLMGVPRHRQTVAPVVMPDISADELWIRRQQREFNLASFSKLEPVRTTKHVRPQFTEAQLRIAMEDHERRRKTA